MQSTVDRHAAIEQRAQRLAPAKPEVERARWKLERALEERDRARERYEASIGTSVELSAYTRLRAASQKVSAADKWLRWAEGEFAFPPPRDDAVMDELLGYE
jgi:hypothetical protein